MTRVSVRIDHHHLSQNRTAHASISTLTFAVLDSICTWRMTASLRVLESAMLDFVWRDRTGGVQVTVDVGSFGMRKAEKPDWSMMRKPRENPFACGGAFGVSTGTECEESLPSTVQYIVL